MTEVSTMTEEFHDWLDQCPVYWFRSKITENYATYSFATPDEENNNKGEQNE